MAHRTYPDSETLFTACGSSDTAVQAAAYQSLWTYLYRVAGHVADRQPDRDALAQDCAQQALIRIHQQRHTCAEPKAFRSWARRIVTNLVIDELRRRQRLQPISETAETYLQAAGDVSLEEVTLDDLTENTLRQMLNAAPISGRSRRVVIGRYLDNQPDEALAAAESELAQKEIRPSHIQVTRAKNIAKLRRWEALRQLLQEK